MIVYLYLGIEMRYKNFLSILLATISTLCTTNTVLAHDHGDRQSGHSEHHMAISIDHARINPTVLGMRVTGVYLNITNNSSDAITLNKVTSPISNRIELHEHSMKDGLMKMQQVPRGINIPAKDSLSLQPGGYHIMIMNLESAIPPNTSVELTLHFSNGKKKVIHAKAVSGSTGIAPTSGHHH